MEGNAAMESLKSIHANVEKVRGSYVSRGKSFDEENQNFLRLKSDKKVSSKEISKVVFLIFKFIFILF